MKSLKTLSLGLLAAASLTGVASAQTATATYVHLVGSTAFRAPATAAIIDYLSNSGTVTVRAAYSGGSLLAAGSAILANGTLGSGGTATVVVETYFTGSLAGVVDLVVGNNTGAYIDPTILTTAQISSINSGSATTSPFGGGTSITPASTVTAAPDIAMSDSFKGTIQSELGTATLTSPITGKNGTFSTIQQLAAATGGNNVVDGGTSGNAADAGFVGIVPFEWVAGNGAPTSITSISQQTARGLIQNGFVPQSYLTGVITDTANYYYLIGRNEDSGTRIGALSESQFGVTGNPKQYTLSGTSAALFPVTPLNTEPQIVWNTLGHSGYASGGNVATAIDIPGGSITFAAGSKAPENSGSSYFIGYLGVTDAVGAITGGGHALAYGGVPFSVAAVQDGQYTFWTYEHSYHLSSLTGTALTAANAIADNIYIRDADILSTGGHAGPGDISAGILDNNTSAVQVLRPLNEGLPLSNY